MSVAVASPPAPTAQAAIPGPLYRFSLDQYRELGRLGLLTNPSRVILLDGLLVTKMTKGLRHSTAYQRCLWAVNALLPAGWIIRPELPIALPGGPQGFASAPEPDLAVVRGDLTTFEARDPGPGDIALLIEVADSSLSDDRAGLARYAWAEVPVAWIVNLPDKKIEVYTDPTGPAADARYATCRVLGPGEDVEVVVDGRICGRLPVADLLA